LASIPGAGGTHRLVPPPVDQSQQCRRIRLQFLQRLALDAGNSSAHQPARLAHLDDHHQGRRQCSGTTWGDPVGVALPDVPKKDSALARWYRMRTEGPSGERKTTMIIALARKLLIALWRLVTTGEVPDGVELRPAA
jgi:hypothetical protein